MRAVRVLLAEYDEAACALMEAHFAGQSDLELCAVARDGVEALQLLEVAAPDILLLSLIMPGMDGIETLRRLREHPPRRPLQIVVLSRVSSPRVVDLCLKLGAAFFIIKPVNMGELFALLRALREDELARRARALLLDMGAPAESLGLKQCCAAAAAIARAPGGTLLMKEAYYAAIAESGSTYVRVEKNIRAMVAAVHRAGAPAYRALLGGALPERPPGNRMFLHWLAAMLR